MTDTTNKPKRPSSITLVSVFGIYGGFMLFYFIFKSDIQNFGLWKTVFFAIGGAIFLVCGFGFWFMKKWAVYAYAVFGILDQIVLLVIGRRNIMALLIPVIVVYIGYKNLSKMT